MAAGIDESGTGMTTSASTIDSRASSSPRRWRASCTFISPHSESGREKEMNSNVHRGGKEGVAPPDLGTLQRHDLAGCHFGDVDAAKRAQRTGLRRQRPSALR